MNQPATRLTQRQYGNFMMTQPNTLHSQNTANSEHWLGIDIGTSGMRALVIPANSRAFDETLATATESMPFPDRQGACSEQSPELWIETLNRLLASLAQKTPLNHITHCILDATSSTVLLGSQQGEAWTSALMYDDRRAQPQASRIARIAPKQSAAHGASSTLAKIMWLEAHQLTVTQQEEAHIFHQIDWVNRYLTGHPVPTDENNALKLGYDPIHQAWPNWIGELTQLCLPKVVSPGTPIGSISPDLAKRFGFDPSMQIVSGTTDSLAAFLATGANRIGDAVTSLGSTLALKLLSDQPIFAPEYGLYSHRLQDRWLVGGASNTGGAVLLKYFDLKTLKQLIAQLKIQQPSGLDYYPLLSNGERFPINDPALAPRVTPRPDSDEQFLQGLLEGLVAIEALGYQRFETLGAPRLKRLFTTGGGTQNTAWMALRSQALPGEMVTVNRADAAFGVTRLLGAKA